MTDNTKSTPKRRTRAGSKKAPPVVQPRNPAPALEAAPEPSPESDPKAAVEAAEVTPAAVSVQMEPEVRQLSPAAVKANAAYDAVMASFAELSAELGPVLATLDIGKGLVKGDFDKPLADLKTGVKSRSRLLSEAKLAMSKGEFEVLLAEVDEGIAFFNDKLKAMRRAAPESINVAKPAEKTFKTRTRSVIALKDCKFQYGTSRGVLKKGERASFPIELCDWLTKSGRAV